MAHRKRRRVGLPWLMLPVLIAGGMVLVRFVRPDPKEIGLNLDRYYPDTCLPKSPWAGTEFSWAAPVSLTRLAIVPMPPVRAI